MTLSYLLQDERKNSGTKLNIHKGESKTIIVHFKDENGAPYVMETLSAVSVKIYKGVGIDPLSIVTGDITKLQCTDLGGYIGFLFTLSDVDTAALPVSGSVAMSAVVESSDRIEMDFPAAFNVTAPLVP